MYYVIQDLSKYLFSNDFKLYNYNYNFAALGEYTFLEADAPAQCSEGKKKGWVVKTHYLPILVQNLSIELDSNGAKVEKHSHIAG